MSRWTDIATKVMNRWVAAATKPPLAPGYMSGMDIMRIRFYELTFAGSVVAGDGASISGNATGRNTFGWFDYDVSKIPANGLRAVAPFYEGFTARLPDQTFVQWLNLDGNKIGSAAAGPASGIWAVQDWTLPTLRAAGLDPIWVDVCQRQAAILTRIQSEKLLPWIPPAVLHHLLTLLNAGYPISMMALHDMRSAPGCYVPQWLEPEARQVAWAGLKETLGQVYGDITAASLQRFQQEAARLQGNVAFWEGVAKWTGVDAIMQQWAELKALVQSFNASKAKALEHVAAQEQILQNNPEAFTKADADKTVALKQGAAAKSEEARSALGPVLPMLVQDGSGLGIAPVVAIVGAAAAVGIAFMAMRAILAALDANVTKTAMEHSAELMRRRDVYLEERAKQEREVILADPTLSTQEKQAMLANIDERNMAAREADAKTTKSTFFDAAEKFGTRASEMFGKIPGWILPVALGICGLLAVGAVAKFLPRRTQP